MDPGSDESKLDTERVAQELLKIKRARKQVLLVEFEDLFEYLYLCHEAIGRVQHQLEVLEEQKTPLRACFVFAAAVSDFYVPAKQMVQP